MNPLQSVTLPNSFAVKRLTDDDFALDTRDKICLYSDACSMVLFYTESPESKRLLNVFKVVAESVPSISFGACNMILEKRVAEAFMSLHMKPDHPFSWCSERAFPFIIIYRNGFPVNFYDGPAEPQIMTNFCLNVACKPEFHCRNFRLIERVREEMWSIYKSKMGITRQEETFELSAAPYKKKI